MSITLNDFIKKTLNLIDDQDIDRELNAVQIKFGVDLFKKELDIIDLDQQISSINKKTQEIKELLYKSFVEEKHEFLSRLFPFTNRDTLSIQNFELSETFNDINPLKPIKRLE